jgi:hypothetical protein
MKPMMGLFLYLVMALSHADGLYIEIGAYAGNTDYSIPGDTYTCIDPTKRGGCGTSQQDAQRIEGPFGFVEVGYLYGGYSVNCFHLSSLSTSRDAGMKLLCGATYRFQ